MFHLALTKAFVFQYIEPILLNSNFQQDVPNQIVLFNYNLTS